MATRRNKVLNGNLATYTGIGGGSALAASILVFALQIYPQLATEEWVKEYVAENAPYTKDEKLLLHRMDNMETALTQIRLDVRSLKDSWSQTYGPRNPKE